MGTGTRDIELVVGGLLHTPCFNDAGKGGCSLYEEHLSFFPNTMMQVYDLKGQIDFNTNPSTIIARYLAYSITSHANCNLMNH